MAKDQVANDGQIDPFIADNIKRWLEALDMKPEQLHNRVHERADIQAVKMIVAGKSYGRIASLLAIAHELGLRLEDIVREPQPTPKALLQFVESPLAPKKDSPDAITEEEWLVLATLSVPRRRLTPECYYLALQMIRKADKSE